jgi:hypothetical protein
MAIPKTVNIMNLFAPTLHYHRLGSLNLTLRAQMELSTYLREEFEESLHKCHLCKEFITTRSQKCADPDCTARLHNSCAARLFRNKDPAARQCPECPNPWDNNQLVEDDDIEEDSDMDGRMKNKIVVYFLSRLSPFFLNLANGSLVSDLVNTFNGTLSLKGIPKPVNRVTASSSVLPVV